MLNMVRYYTLKKTSVKDCMLTDSQLAFQSAIADTATHIPSAKVDWVLRTVGPRTLDTIDGCLHGLLARHRQGVNHRRQLPFGAASGSRPPAAGTRA